MAERAPNDPKTRRKVTAGGGDNAGATTGTKSRGKGTRQRAGGARQHERSWRHELGRGRPPGSKRGCHGRRAASRKQQDRTPRVVWPRWETAAGSNRCWSTLERCGSGKLSTTRAMTSFQTLVIAHDEVCRSRVDGFQCQNGGYNRQGPTRCGGCCAADREIGCQVCGTARDTRSQEWIHGQLDPTLRGLHRGEPSAAAERTVQGLRYSQNSARWTAPALAKSSHGAQKQRQFGFVGNMIRRAEGIEWLTATPVVPVTTRAAGRLRGDWEERASK